MNWERPFYLSCVSDQRQQREAEHRENLATTIRTLRAEDSQKMLEIVGWTCANGREQRLKSFTGKVENEDVGIGPVAGSGGCPRTCPENKPVQRGSDD